MTITSPPLAGVPAVTVALAPMNASTLPATSAMATPAPKPAPRPAARPPPICTRSTVCRAVAVTLRSAWTTASTPMKAVVPLGTTVASDAVTTALSWVRLLTVVRPPATVVPSRLVLSGVVSLPLVSVVL